MNKKIFALLTVSLLMCSCSTNEQKDYVTVTFNLNYETTNNVYLNKVVFENTTLSKPTEPNRRDYVFEGWYKDAECVDKFYDFGKEIDEDIVLYAKWSSYEELEDFEKVDRFLEKLDKLSGNVYNASMDYESIEVYYSPAAIESSYSEKREYNRYKDITVLDFYSIDEEKTATQQYSYNDEYLYTIYHDIQGSGKDNLKKTTALDTEKIESHLSINFSNLNCYVLRNLSTLLKNNAFTESEDYSFNFNYTHLDSTALNYSFTCEYIITTINEEIGVAQQMFTLDAGVSFVNGEIKRSKVVEEYAFAISGEIQYYYQDVYQTNYSTTDEYSRFTGDRFNLEDF